MRMADMKALRLLLLIAPMAVLAAAPAPPSGYRFELTHVDAKGGYTKTELLRRAEERTTRRRATGAMRGGAGRTSSSSSGSPGTIQPRLCNSGGEYLLELSIGTPPVPLQGIADTGSDLIWTQSQPCARCQPQRTPLYNPFKSRTFSVVPCSSTMCRGTLGFPLRHTCTTTSPPLCRFGISYGDGSVHIIGVVGTETLTFRSSAPGGSAVSVAGVAFGCANDGNAPLFGGTGLVGLGRGPQSLVAQLGFGKFSYCLTDDEESKPIKSSPLLLGSLAALPAGAAVQTTQLVQSPQNPTFYYVSLEGISLGDARLPIPKDAFPLRSDGTGGIIVDSGTTYTALVEKAYAVVVKHVVEAIGLVQTNTTYLREPCYWIQDGTEPRFPPPDLVLHFAGGADMRLKWDSYMVRYGDEALCFLLESDPGMSILGNHQIKNMHMLFDVTVGLLSFAPADCAKL